jgi:hypothetical protein
MLVIISAPFASAALSIDKCFVSWVNYRGGILNQEKQSCGSTAKEMNGLEDYQGHHYLRCYVGANFYVDTGRVWHDVGFTLRTDYTSAGNGTGYAKYGTIE